MKLKDLKNLYPRTFDYTNYDFDKNKNAIILFRRPNESFGHYIGIICRNNNIYFFDSYASNPFNILDHFLSSDPYYDYKYTQFFNSFKHRYANNVKYQNLNSKVCAYYALLFVLYNKKISEFNDEFADVIDNRKKLNLDNETDKENNKNDNVAKNLIIKINNLLEIN